MSSKIKAMCLLDQLIEKLEKNIQANA
jgi:hypothetical protein